MIVFGSKVVVTHTYYRIESGGGPNGVPKRWHRRSLSKPRQGIYIGSRTLSDGNVRYDEYGIGEFYAEKYYQAGLVVFNARENPVYVPLDAIEEMQ